ncbi:hypothetical protein [Enterocloster citroniae]|uniref:hypothetical protein n=1 Tax=Enterocloster citroniae TaxID=358743 RepID=UPI00189ADE85|nr:hypothetical protein [Enterocloster citroniae]
MECMNELDFGTACTAVLTAREPIVIPGTKNFRMADHIKIGTVIGDYRVTYVGKSFMKHFGSVEETDIPDIRLNMSTLEEWAMDPDVIKGLGGPDMICDNYMYHLVEIIKMGPEGPGLFNGYTNLFYKQSPVDGRLWSPHFYLRGDRLGFGALPACYDDGWEPGDRIFTCLHP